MKIAMRKYSQPKWDRDLDIFQNMGYVRQVRVRRTWKNLHRIATSFKKGAILSTPKTSENYEYNNSEIREDSTHTPLNWHALRKSQPYEKPREGTKTLPSIRKSTSRSAHQCPFNLVKKRHFHLFFCMTRDINMATKFIPPRKRGIVLLKLHTLVEKNWIELKLCVINIS